MAIAGEVHHIRYKVVDIAAAREFSKVLVSKMFTGTNHFEVWMEGTELERVINIAYCNGYYVSR